VVAVCHPDDLLNPRYRGVYVHGRIKKVRQNGGRVRVKADPKEMITVDIQEWRVIGDAISFAVNEGFPSRGPGRAGRSAAKYPLTASRTATYAAARARVRWRRHAFYARAAKHHERGSAVCPVTVHQPIHEIETALVAHLQ
jgi:hypothetical protein